jgi:predicted nucleic acid-binding protein
MADSLILAIAQAERAALWTQDEHFKDIPGVEYRQKSGA